MKSFEVAYEVQGTVTYFVEANSEEEAKEVAQKLLWDEAQDFELDIYHVEVQSL